MLMVRARVAPSDLHGLGLFAAEFVPRGTVVWTFVAGFDRTFTRDQLLELPTHVREQVLFYCDGDFDPATGVHTLSGDDARFTNHSDQPNTANAPDGISTVAIRDIQAGEEITWDYRSFGRPLSFGPGPRS
ncbi:MAG: SET domain-containing protein [Phycisphaerales bacterium]|nr:SET domain-containing protein [Phycisphaerales bacterium]